ncbi:addiction module protein [Propionimicrobium sp. PCR01-08-3]|uniref:addiction module protein n=1 Tax=Propionimicrobium sp. PCR01-08-3 TaxID=3052086 RepID=UPI00255CC82A|nr:addiction module protein [Propionimicrobium sp. PCR01-08-3]WIY81452.1 addiction module protein [Propionimicrobium sp. PCR01-08-3]
MTPKLADYIAEGKALSADEREIASLALQQVDDVEQAEVDSAWEEEIDRRVDEILSGKVELVDGEETRSIIRAELAARHK